MEGTASQSCWLMQHVQQQVPVSDWLMQQHFHNIWYVGAAPAVAVFLVATARLVDVLLLDVGSDVTH
jgi:hypothetical protein